MAGLRSIIIMCALMVLTVVFATPAKAQPELRDTTCMPAVMTAIEARGLLEAEREIIQNQNLIAKPDSVLEYSCFEQHLTLSGDVTGQMFTEAEWYFGISDSFIDQYTLDRGIYYVVFQALVAYLRENYWHQYLGDRAELAALSLVPGEFNCYAMGYIWNRARCSNFIIPRTGQDGFYTFDEYRTMDDPRNLPEPQQCETWPEWSAEITDSNAMSAPLPTGAATVAALEDELNVYPELFDPDDCASSPAIPTGMLVPPYPEQDAYDEHICLAPGCYYNGTTCAR